MFDTIEEISKTKFINNLVNDANAFGLLGVYANFKEAVNPQYNGFYFVCGYLPEIVMDKTLNLEKLYIEQGKKGRIDLHITKITNQSPFNVHQDVANYCLHASTLRGLANKVGFDKPFRRVSTSFISLAEMLYLNSRDGRLSFLERERNSLTLKEFFKREGNREYLLDGNTGDGADLHMRPEKLDKSIPNMVSLEELVYRTFGTERMVVSYDMLDPIKREFAKHPEILFFQAKPIITRLRVPDNQGYGSKEKNERSSVVIVYDAFYKKQAEIMYLRVKNPQLFYYSLNDIQKIGRGTVPFGIGAKDLSIVFKRAHEERMPICLDPNNLYYTCDGSYSETNVAGYNVIISKEDILKMDNILLLEAMGAKSRRILRRDDIENYNYNPRRD